MIKKTKKGYRVVSKKGRNLGDEKTLKGAKERLAEVEYFKHKRPRILGE